MEEEVEIDEKLHPIEKFIYGSAEFLKRNPLLVLIGMGGVAAAGFAAYELIEHPNNEIYHGEKNYCKVNAVSGIGIAEYPDYIETNLSCAEACPKGNIMMQFSCEPVEK